MRNILAAVFIMIIIFKLEAQDYKTNQILCPSLLELKLGQVSYF